MAHIVSLATVINKQTREESRRSELRKYLQGAQAAAAKAETRYELTGRMTKAAAEAIAGTLGKPSKMPGTSYGIPAQACQTGSALQQVAGSTCSGCYALKGQYMYTSVYKGQLRRMQGLRSQYWVDALVHMIDATGTRWHRWHDAGDLQDEGHLRNIVEVAERMPHVSFWLPTREAGIVRAYIALHGSVPNNLTIRVSDTMVDGKPRTVPHTVTSGVHDAAEPSHGAIACPAPQQDNECKSCRMCWDSSIPRVSYHKH